MKSLYNRRGSRRTDAERHQFAFFVAGAVVLLAVIFVIGIQAGRVIERKWGKPPVAAGKTTPGPIVEGRPGNAATLNVGKEMAAFADEAAKVPPVKPQSAREQLEETERSLTFRRTLSRRAPEPVPLTERAEAPPATANPRVAGRTGTSGYSVQAGAFRDRAGANALATKVSKIGMTGTVTEGRGKNGMAFYRVLVGPFGSREKARAAIRTLKRRMKIDAFLTKG
ncbi:MAG: SPOR domain-containing protein [Deltaproteobacteria bacterium]|nr:SPOR domain-containing protein [Deltaproteobacteria bacterium]